MQDGLRIKLENNGTLLINTARKQDAGNYLCKAENEVEPPLSKVAPISVHGKHIELNIYVGLFIL